jgi:hypothetical protein
MQEIQTNSYPILVEQIGQEQEQLHTCKTFPETKKLNYLNKRTKPTRSVFQERKASVRRSGSLGRSCPEIFLA